MKKFFALHCTIYTTVDVRVIFNTVMNVLITKMLGMMHSKKKYKKEVLCIAEGI